MMALRAASLPTGAALILAGALAPPPPAAAHDSYTAIAAKRFLLRLPAKPARHKLELRARKGVPVYLNHDPRFDGSAFFLRSTGPGGARTAVVPLERSRWKLRLTPDGAQLRYRDPRGRHGGVRKVRLGGGTFSLLAKGPNVPTEVDGPVDELWLHFQIGDDWWCARLEGSAAKRNRAGAIMGRGLAPAACPLAVCGNGALELGEGCDDGNLADTDGCASDCATAACELRSFESTWEAVDRLVLEGGGCRDPACHGSASGEGGLDLRPEVAYENLVGAPAANRLLDRVEPGDQDLSMLYLKLAAATLPALYRDVPGSPMPSGGLPPIGEDALEGLRLWIRGGAPHTGVVEGTAQHFDACLPEPDPLKIPALDPPPSGTGVQLHAPPWSLPARSEHEICYATYYDLTQLPGGVPDWARLPCPPEHGGPATECFRYHETALAQDPQSHHSIIAIYTGSATPSHPGWGAWTCKGGPLDGSVCEPTGFGTPAPAGADCGPGGGCASRIAHATACFGFGPDGNVPQTVGGGFAGSQEPLARQTFADGVYNVLPLRGTVVWNSHAFNLTGTDTTMEQYLNLIFAEPEHQRYAVRTVFPLAHIFAMSVPPFTTQEVCATFTYPQRSRVFELSSHVHKRGALFRIWGPPQAPCSPGPDCLPPAGPPLYVSTEYSDPVRLPFSPPVPLDSGLPQDRTYRYCAVFDNGKSDPAEVKRCGSVPCTVVGGTTTDDEMFLMLSSYYVEE